MAAMKQLIWVGIVAGLVATASADSKMATKAADQWVASVRADRPVAVSKARPVGFWNEVPSTTACQTHKAVTADDAKAIGKCLRELGARFGAADGFGTGEVVKLAMMTDGVADADKKAIEAAARGTTVVAYYGNGDGETLSIYVAVGKDGTVKAVVANAEAAE